MPGSPPRRVTEPGTSPPPSTRSNSATPVGTRSPSSPPMSASDTTAAGVGLGPAPDPDVAVDRSTSSTNVFHSPQPGQRPVHCGDAEPQSVQR